MTGDHVVSEWSVTCSPTAATSYSLVGLTFLPSDNMRWKRVRKTWQEEKQKAILLSVFQFHCYWKSQNHNTDYTLIALMLLFGVAPELERQ